MAKTKTQKVNTFAPKVKKKTAKASKKWSKMKNSKLYKKEYRGQGR